MSATDAEQLLSQALGRPVRVTQVRPTTGGMVSSVWDVRFEHCDARPGSPPGRAALKISDQAGAFAGEAEGLWHLARAGFPVPAVLGVVDGPPSALALDWLDGRPLGEVPLTEAQADALDVAIARAVAELHHHTRDTFGDVTGRNPQARWVDVFRPRFARMVDACTGRTAERTTDVARAVLAALDDLLGPSTGPARLVHGDLWANNLLVGADRRGGLTLRGFIDPGAEYAEREYEIAYLECFRTVGRRFFEVYGQQHTLADDYPPRRAVYHLQTMLIHIHHFGDAHYHQRAARLAEALAEVV